MPRKGCARHGVRGVLRGPMQRVASMSARCLFRCPCCGFRTLSERSSWEICNVCWWEDDGQDDPNADEVWGGPNARYSLSVARTNFFSHQHMYDQRKGISVVEQPSPERSSLLEYVRSVLSGQEDLDDGKLQKGSTLIEQPVAAIKRNWWCS